MTNPARHSIGKLRLRTWALAGLLLLGAGLAGAATLPPEALGTQWYAISILGNRSGWSEQSLNVTPDGLVSTEHTVLRVRLEAQTLTSARTETRRYDADWRLVSLEHEADQIGRPVYVTARREGDKLLVTRRSPDGETKKELDLPADFGLEMRVLQALLDGQLKVGWEQTFTSFDADMTSLDTITLRVVARLEGEEPGWRLETRSKVLGMAMETEVSDTGVLLRQSAPGMLGMKLERVTQQEALADLEPFLLSSSVPVEQDLGDPEKLTQVRLQVSSSSSAPETLFPNTPRQTMAVVDGAAILTVRQGRVPQVTVKLPVTGAEFLPFLQPSAVAPSDDARVQAKAREIIGNERNAWAAARLLMAWVYRNMVKVSSEPRPMSALEVLGAMQGDCTEHTVLLAALAQSVGIPARMVAGLTYADKAFHYHAWNELYVGEWVEMDATWGEETLDAGHVQIAAAALDGAAIARMSLASSKTMGTLGLKVLEWASR
jgi:hypothetical protein